MFLAPAEEEKNDRDEELVKDFHFRAILRLMVFHLRLELSFEWNFVGLNLDRLCFFI